MKILFVCETSSIHSAKWINQLDNSIFDIYIFQAIAPGNGINTLLKNGKIIYPGLIKNSQIIFSTFGIPNIILKILAKISFLKNFIQKKHNNVLYKMISEINPDIIHSLGLCVNFENLLLPVYYAKIKSRNSGFPKWIYSSWGTDFSYYAKLSTKISSEVSMVVEHCDFLITECDRDTVLAKKYGFNGKFLGKLPAFGGVNLNKIKELNSKKTSERRFIIIKGRDHQNGGDPIGRAMYIINSLKLISKYLADYQIKIIQASTIVRETSRELINKYNLNLEIIDNIEYEELFKIFANSRIFISLTIADGLPGFLAESFTFGAFPIYSNLESIKEWIQDGINGFLITEDCNMISTSILKAIQNDILVDKAAEVNLEILQSRLEYNLIRNRVRNIYHEIVKHNF
jgi:glycosyltransferase involved in cell wall biosynthesis